MIKKSDIKKWTKLKIIELDGIIAFGDAPPNMKKFIKLYDPMKKWCKENCNGRYKFYIIDEGWHTDAMYVGYSYHFEDKCDAVAFKLRWEDAKS